MTADVRTSTAPVGPSPRLVLGSAALGLPYGLPRPGGREASEREVGELLRALDPSTCRAVDTAAAYGSAEERLGRWLPSDVPVWTKLDTGCRPGPRLWEEVERSLDRSLARLRRDRIELLQWHNGTAELFEDESFRRTVARLRDDPRCAALGCSTYGPTDALAAVESDLFSCVQVEWNVWRQGVVDAIGEEPRRRSIRVAVRSVLLQGVLATSDAPLPEHLTPLVEPRARLSAVAERLGLDPGGFALAAAVVEPRIDFVLVGARNLDEWQLALVQARVENADAVRRATRQCDRGDDPLTDPRTWPDPK